MTATLENRSSWVARILSSSSVCFRSLMFRMIPTACHWFLSLTEDSESSIGISCWFFVNAVSSSVCPMAFPCPVLRKLLNPF